MYFQRLRFLKRLKAPNQHKPYIVPTIYGVAYLFMIVNIFALGYYRYDAPFHTVGLTLIIFGMVAMIQSNSNLQFIDISVDPLEFGAAEETTTLEVALRNTAPTLAYNLAIQVDKPFSMPRSLPLQVPELVSQAKFKLPIQCPRRGVYPLKRIKVFSRGVYGLFYAWRWQKVPAELIVYPRPRGSLPLPVDHQGASRRNLNSEDFVGHRPFQPGDSLRQIDWKAYARGSDLLLKDFADHAHESLHLRWEDTKGPTESRLEQLCTWIFQMTEMQRPFSLQLPDFFLEKGTGDAHQKHALRALAAFKGE